MTPSHPAPEDEKPYCARFLEHFSPGQEFCHWCGGCAKCGKKYHSPHWRHGDPVVPTPPSPAVYRRGGETPPAPLDNEVDNRKQNTLQSTSAPDTSKNSPKTEVSEEHLNQTEVSAPKDSLRLPPESQLKEDLADVATAPEWDWEVEFDKELTISHPGDSGMGGNDPQEPTYQMAADPEDVKLFIHQTLKSQATQLMEVIEGKKIDTRQLPPRDFERYGIYNAALNEVLSELKKLI